MYSKQVLILNSIKRIFVIVTLFMLSMKVYSNDISSLPKLTLTPNQCISLHQGQQCFVTVNISWQMSHAGKYCLYSSLQNKKITCWLMTKSAQFKQELVIDKDVTFTLKSMDDAIENGEVIANAVLELAWVHKKSRRSHSAWRVF